MAERRNKWINSLPSARRTRGSGCSWSSAERESRRSGLSSGRRQCPRCRSLGASSGQSCERSPTSSGLPASERASAAESSSCARSANKYNKHTKSIRRLPSILSPAASLTPSSGANYSGGGGGGGGKSKLLHQSSPI